MSKKIIIVGGVAGGATAAARLRRLDEEAEIILFERGEYISFANCGLPYYIGGVIENRDSLFVARKEDVSAKYNIDIRNFSEVIAIHKAEKTVDVRNTTTGETYTESYDKLLLSTGSSPIVPPLPGVDQDNVFTLWNIPDTDKVYSFIEYHSPQRAVVVGGGFIGLEMVENLVARGLHVTLVELADQVMAPFDKDMALLIENHLREQGVEVILGKALASVEEGGAHVLLEDGQKIPADMILLSIGVRPNNQLAKEAGLELNQRGGVVVNDYMETSDPHIYAVGDVAEVLDFNTKTPTMVPLAGPANKQGRLVAGQLLDNRREAYTGTQGTSIAKIFELSAGSTGMNEKALEKAGKVYRKDYLVSLLHSSSHAGYYPDSLQMVIKLIFDMEGKVLGSQILGYDGVDKRIDVIATAIRFGGTVEDLARLELAYAPPYSSAKDPVNMAGFTAQNILEKLTDPILPRELEKELANATLLDVREDEEVQMGKVEGSVHIPLTKLRDRIGELDPNRTYITYCAVGARGYFAERILKERNYKARNLMGGFRTYQDTFHGPQTRRSTAPTDQEGRLLPGKPAPKETGSGEDPEAVPLTNLCGLSCPGPIVQVNKLLADKAEGGCVRVVATDPGFARDIDSWCENTGNLLLDNYQEGGKFYATIQKGTEAPAEAAANVGSGNKEKTMIVFSGELDKAIASFIIANGAAAMGNKVNMFFTFWGLNILRKPEPVSAPKDFMGKMFGAMMPRGSQKLKLSNMNFFGAGAKMIRSVMKNKNISSLEELIAQAQEAGVKMTACQMSMDVMGITKEELLDGVEIGGVASMLNDNDHSNMNLFV